MNALCRLLHIADFLAEWLLTLFLLLLAAVGIYTVWDNEQVYRSADAAVYAAYIPEEADDAPAFEELRRLNPDIFGWLRVDGTAINYPLVQGSDNFTYVNSDVLGNFSLSGSIFLDYRCAADFSGTNNILYGHHMDKNSMFGPMEDFADDNFFASHRSGSVYYGGAWHTVIFFAFLQADAYDPVLYDTTLTDAPTLLAYLRSHAAHFTEEDFSVNSRFVTLSTCASTGMSNSRHLLVGLLAS